jgi:DNA-binding MarR family transcriptional regulator
MEIGRQLRDALQALLVAHGALEPARRPCGAQLSLPHAYALLALQREALSVSALSARLRINQSNVSRLCKRMEQAGELIRAIDPTDRRARVLQLTQTGQQLAAAVDASSAGYFEAVVRQLPDAIATAEALEHLTNALIAQRNA